MQVCGLEWAHRLFQEPKRLFKRYIVVGVPFAGGLLAKSLARGVPNRLRRRSPLRGFEPAGAANSNGHAAAAETLIVDPIPLAPEPAQMSTTRS
jgi:hypothetical protein